MHVDTDNNHHVGYLLGRLFAVIEYAQQRGKDGSEPIRAQMLGTASTILSVYFQICSDCIIGALLK